MRILLVEDDETIVEVLKPALVKQNYSIDVATDGETGWELLKHRAYDLVLLDVVLPKLDGISLCRQLRATKNPVLVLLLTARDAMTDRLLGLDSGADDYMVKPFHVQELIARIRALLRRGSTAPSSILLCGSLRLDPQTREVSYAGHPLQFSRKEYLLLELFLRHPQHVFSRRAIVERLWGLEEEAPNDDTIKSHIKNIRRELKRVGTEDLIETLYGQGYRINPAYLTADSTLESSSAQEDSSTALESMTAAIWERAKGTTLERVLFLEQTVQELQANALTENLRQQAKHAAHKLAGSLGTFGFDAGSHLARLLEDYLEPPLEPDQRSLAQTTHALVVALRQQLTLPRVELSDRHSTQQFPPSSETASVLQKTTLGLAVAAKRHQPLLLIIAPHSDVASQLVAEAHCWNIETAIAPNLTTAHGQIQHRTPSVILLDWSLICKSEEESELFSDLARHLPSVPILIYGATSDCTAHRITAVRSGGQRFIPQSTPMPQIMRTIADLMQISDRQPSTILAVDDDPQILLTLRTTLESYNIRLIELEDPTQFWETLNTTQPDMLIVDINMPQISGLELCQSVRQDIEWDWLPILCLTAHIHPQTVQQAFAAGVDDYITKPISPPDFSVRLLNRLHRSLSFRTRQAL